MKEDNATQAISSKKDKICKRCLAQTVCLGVACVMLMVSTYVIYQMRMSSKNCDSAHITEIACKVQNVRQTVHQLSDAVRALEDLRDEMQIVRDDITQLQDQKGCSCNSAVIREKWATWVNLKRKIARFEVTDEDVLRFNSLFADDQEVVRLVSELMNSINSSDKWIPDAISEYLGKIKLFKVVDVKRMNDIDGYVLTSGSRRE